MEELLNKIKNIVYECGNIILNANLDELEIEEKTGKNNIVTKYDKEVQDKLKIELLKLIPNSKFIGEESKNNILDDSYTFIVDPIDGTTNFSRNLHFSSISVALLKSREPILAVCYNPYLNEMFTAIKGGCAYLNDKLIHQSDKKLSEGIILYDVPSYYSDLLDKSHIIQKKLCSIAGDFRSYGSAVLEICYVACGKVEAYVHLRLQPWDYAGASLIAKESGCIIKTLNDEDIKYDKQSSIIVTNNIDNYNKVKNIEGISNNEIN